MAPSLARSSRPDASSPLQNVGVKRKGDDVDHVFLRFGKRAFNMY